MTGSESTLTHRVEQYLASEDAVEGPSWEELVDELDQQLSAAPTPDAFALRARMFMAAYEPYKAMCDWERAMALEPGEREAALELALLQLDQPARLAESAVRQAKHVAADNPAQASEDDGIEEDGDDDRDEEDDWDDADEKRAQSLVAHYVASATASLSGLIDAQRSDPVFLQRVFAQIHGVDVWVHYTLLLKALATHPDDPGLRATEAYFLVALASHCDGDSEEIPAGCWDSVSGARLHVASVERAVRCIDEVCALAPDAGLTRSKAELLAEIEHYPAAAAAYRLAATLFDRDAARAVDEGRYELSSQADSARTQAALCDQGRQAINEANFASMEEAAQQFAALRARMGQQADPDDPMASTIAQLRGALEQGDQAMTGEQRADYLRIADDVAGKAAGMVSIEPVALLPIARADLEGGLIAWFDDVRAAIEARGMTLGAQFDNPANNRLLGTQCQGQWWTDDHGSSALVLEAVRSIRLRRLMTQLSDNTFMITVDDRGHSFWQYGPAIDVLSIDRATPIEAMVDLHMARVARALAARPDLRTLPIDSLDRLAEAENGARVAKLDFRFKEKVTEVEVRGMHVRFHDEFKAMLHAAIGRRLDAMGKH